MSMRVLDPTMPEEIVTTARVTGLFSLVGRKIGLLDNGKINVKPFLDHVEEILRLRHGVKTVIRLRKADASRPAPPEVQAAMAGCDVLISAVGD